MEEQTIPLTDYRSDKILDSNEKKEKAKRRVRKERKKRKKSDKRARKNARKYQKLKAELKAERLVNTERERRYQAEADRKILAALLRISCSVNGGNWPSLTELPEPPLGYAEGGAANL